MIPLLRPRHRSVCDKTYSITDKARVFLPQARRGAEGVAGFPQAPHPVRTSGIGEDDDAHVYPTGHAEPRPGQLELLQLYRSQPDSAGDLTPLGYAIGLQRHR